MVSYASDFSSAGPAREYASNVRATARAFVAALFALKSQAPLAAAPKRPVSARTRANNLMALHRIATEYEATMPGMASELRCLAARG